jgi:hypothetical protein
VIKNPILAGLCILIVMCLVALDITASPCELPDGTLMEVCDE